MNYTDEAFADGSARRHPVQPKRRFCKITGCTRIVKSQGLCQRHGAKPRQCRIAGCTKQAQGSFEKMCSTFSRFLCDSIDPSADLYVCIHLVHFSFICILLRMSLQSSPHSLYCWSMCPSECASRLSSPRRRCCSRAQLCFCSWRRLSYK